MNEKHDRSWEIRYGWNKFLSQEFGRKKRGAYSTKLLQTSGDTRSSPTIFFTLFIFIPLTSFFMYFHFDRSFFMFYIFRIHPVQTHCPIKTAHELAPQSNSVPVPRITGNSLRTQNAQQQQEQDLCNHLLRRLVQCFAQSRKEQI
jgi:hypothetical protein